MDTNTPGSEDLDPVVSIIVFIIGVVITIIPFWKIFSKAGYSGWLSLLMLIPLVNIFLLFYLAFAKWPILRARESRQTPDSNLPSSTTL